MQYQELKDYFNHHCKIRLRSGKEVFGVIWEELNETDRAIYFASFIEHKKSLSRKNGSSSEELKFKISEDEIVGVVPV